MGQQNGKQQKPMEKEEDETDLILVEEIATLTVMEQQKQRPHRRRLPLEMECEVFKCLKQPIQFKFIWAMGRGIYGVFGHKLLTKSTRLRNPKGNFLNKSKTKAIVSPEGFRVGSILGHVSVLGQKGFAISPKYARHDHFPGTIIYYFEVTRRAFSTNNAYFFVGLTNGSILDAYSIGSMSNSYAIEHGNKSFCFIENKVHSFELPENQPAYNGSGDVLGCGLLMNPKNSVAIFFTSNGILMGKPIPISPSVGCLYPTVTMRNASLEFNFGDNLAKPFKFDMHKCPELAVQ